MLFNSLDFLYFLIIVLCLYHALDKAWRWQNLLIVVASYVFYGWWNWELLILIATTTLLSYLSGILQTPAATSGGTTRNKWICGTNIVVNLGLLAVFKYYNFFVESFAALFGLDATSWTLNLILPVGISFYTFQALSYSIDVYRGKIEPTRDLVAFTAYISFFPQLVAGPIERATNLLPQFLAPRTFDPAVAGDGGRQMMWGLFKKVIVADGCARIIEYYWGKTDDAAANIVCAILFTFQIYGDFSGYSDIAIGCAKLFGIRLRRNFNVPFFSRDIAEFWRRWHISLNTWFVDYLYIPLGGSRGGKWTTVRNTFAIFLVSGLWHGANWTYVCWGLMHALFFIPLILTGRNRRYLDIVAADRKLPSRRDLARMLGTFALVVIAFVIFRAKDIGEGATVLCNMVSLDAWKCIPFFFASTDGACAWIAFMIIVEWIQRKKEHGLQMDVKWYVRYPIYMAFILAFIMFMGENQQFIYFQF